MIDLLTGKIKSAAAAYPDRTFGNEADQQLKSLLSKAGKLQGKTDQGRNPCGGIKRRAFTTARDSLDFRGFSHGLEKRAGGTAGWKSENCE